MEITFLNIALVLITLLFIPVFVGSVVVRWSGIDKSLTNSYIFGFVSIWALIQLITVPLVLLKADFRVVVLLVIVWIVGMIAYSVHKKCCPQMMIETQTTGQKGAVIAMLFMIAAVMITSLLLQHTDADDSRFVVNAVDIIKTNKMFLSNPATGEFLGIWKGELTKDVTSPWAVYIAFLSKITGIHPTIMAHTIMPISLLVMAYCVFWLLSKEFFGQDITSRSFFVIVMVLLNVYGYYSLYGAETFMMTRIWQGKAVVASVGIPILLLEFLWIYKENNRKRLYCVLYMTQFALCLMSGMGIVIGAIMAGCYGLIYGISKKNWKMILLIWLSALPNVVFYLIHEWI